MEIIENATDHSIGKVMKRSNELLTIISVNYNTTDFIKLMLYSFSNLTINTFKVIICDNGSNEQEKKKLSRILQDHTNVETIFRKQSTPGSIGHAEALDIMVKKVDTKYFVVMDSDCCFLKYGWDIELLEYFNDTVKVVGTSLPADSSGGKPIDFPLVFAVMYETSVFKRLRVSFMPNYDNVAKKKDTGWEVKEKYIQDNYRGYTFKSINTRYDGSTEFGDILCAVYYLENK